MAQSRQRKEDRGLPWNLWVVPLVALAVVSGSGEALAAPGDLDPGFGGGAGRVTTDISGNADTATALVLQPDGKLVAAGRCFNGADNDFCLARYNPDGSLDEGFGTGGRVMTDVVLADSVAAVALQADGKLVVAGSCSDGVTTEFCVVRYSAAGVVDGDFGTGGVVSTAFGTGFDNATAIVVQPDGKLVVAGECFMGSPTDDDFCLARYETDGALDPTFGTGGKVTTDLSGNVFDAAFALALQPDGKLVAAGQCDGPDGSEDFCLARYNPDGSLDATFGTGGTVITAIIANKEDRGFAVAIQADGRIVLAGLCGPIGGPFDFCVARYDANGSLDGSFDGDGKVVTPVGAGDDQAFGLALQADGKPIVAGRCDVLGTRDFCLVRYNSDGSLDTTFSGGKVTTAIGLSNDEAFGVLVQADGKAVAAGACDMATTRDFCLARYEGDSFVDLEDIIEGLDLPQGTEQRLIATLNAAEAAKARGSLGAASQQLNAFIHEVEAQRGKALTPAEADMLIAYARSLIALL